MRIFLVLIGILENYSLFQSFSKTFQVKFSDMNRIHQPNVMLFYLDILVVFVTTRRVYCANMLWVGAQ